MPALSKAEGPALIEASALSKFYRSKSGGLWGGRKTLTALCRVSLTLEEGESLGLVGESGSGKTTLGKIIAGLLDPDEGKLRLQGEEAGLLTRLERARFVQMVFQDPATALNPKLSIETQIGEALRLRSGTLARREGAALWLKRVGLPPDMLSCYPHQLSGGQKQRANIARAAAGGPKVIIADEPVSSLDLSIQGQILKLLVDLKSELGISYLVISHDLSVVAALCDRMIVLKDGTVQEKGKTVDILNHPSRPYTKKLIDSVPRLKKQ
jgi:peptide/nickel transport system ATP-binding protein